MKKTAPIVVQVKTNGKGEGKKPKNPKPKRPPTVQGGGLDTPALAYARLLADPCGSPLAHPVYAGGDGGYLIRCETFVTFANGVGNSAGILHWVPGAIAADGNELILNSVADGSVAAAIGTSGTVLAPGRAFLAANAVAYRCVAACVKIGYAGSESTRSGRLHYGRTAGAYLDPGQVVGPDNAAQGLPHYTRTPPAEVEINWIPTDADQLLVDPNTPTTVDRLRRGAITIAASSLPATVGLTVRMTAIYEWQPGQGQGLAVPYESRARSRNTLDQVLNVVQKAAQGAKRMAGAASDMAYVYGLMPTYQVNRGIAY